MLRKEHRRYFRSSDRVTGIPLRSDYRKCGPIPQRSEISGYSYSLGIFSTEPEAIYIKRSPLAIYPQCKHEQINGFFLSPRSSSLRPSLASSSLQRRGLLRRENREPRRFYLRHGKPLPPGWALRHRHPPASLRRVLPSGTHWPLLRRTTHHRLHRFLIFFFKFF